MPEGFKSFSKFIIVCIGSVQVFNISDSEFVLPAADAGCIHSTRGLPTGYARWAVCGYNGCSRLFPCPSPVWNVVADHGEFDALSVVARIHWCVHPQCRSDYCVSNSRRSYVSKSNPRTCAAPCFACECVCLRREVFVESESVVEDPREDRVQVSLLRQRELLLT